MGDRNGEEQQQSSSAGLAPLGARILTSVYTIETAAALGTARAAWTNNGSTYLITANHLIPTLTLGVTMTIKRKNSNGKHHRQSRRHQVEHPPLRAPRWESCGKVHPPLSASPRASAC